MWGPRTVVVKAGVVKAAAVAAAKVAAAIGPGAVAVCRGCCAALASQAEVGPQEQARQVLHLRGASRGSTGNNAPARPHQHAHKHYHGQTMRLTAPLPFSGVARLQWHVCKGSMLCTRSTAQGAGAGDNGRTLSRRHARMAQMHGRP